MSPIDAMNVAAVWTFDAGHAHQPRNVWPRERLAGDLAIESRDLLVEKVDLAQTSIEGQALIDGQLERLEPLPAALPEGVGDRRALAEITSQHSMRFVLGARPRSHEPRSRRLVSRRSVRVRSSGVQTSSSRPEANSLASVCASR